MVDQDRILWFFRIGFFLQDIGRKKRKLTDTGLFWFYLDNWTKWIFQIGYWIKIDAYQSTSTSKVYPQGCVNKSITARLFLFRIYRGGRRLTVELVGLLPRRVRKTTIT